MKGERVVVKFGGASLSSGSKVRKAAKMIIDSGYKEIVVVVSAMGNATDRLIRIIKEIGEVSPKDYADIISMGERTSVRIFSAALKSLGVDSIYLDPKCREWPVITDSNYIYAKPDLEETRKRVKKYVEPLLGKVIPVICGFLGVNANGDITTLGRGGSDTTALLLANCLGADEVILVKDTEGVMSADPRIVPDAKPLPQLDIQELFTLARGGAKIVKAEALMYKLPNQKLRIVSFSNGITSKGTEIIGVFNPLAPKVKFKRGLLAVSLVCEIDPSDIGKIFAAFEDRQIYGISTGRYSLTLFTSSENATSLMRKLHDLRISKALSCKENVGMLEITHPSFIDSPGWVAKISSALASKSINIIEITTSKATINIFIDESYLEEAIEAVRVTLEA
ncbi:TPA: aspartate kinase [Candidatus Bathyarchaeota archaeon]|nr:aspartate kinase [Candidatus Bathyarchaeota archaeon]